LAIISEQRSKHTPRSKSQLIEEYITKLALNAGQPADHLVMGVYQSIWEEGFEDLSYSVLEAAFKKTLQTCRFWPIKLADIRGQVDVAVRSATEAAAATAWERALDLRRRHWNPDVPGGFSRGMPKLSDREKRAANACGIFKREDCDHASLHEWMRKTFIESYIAFDQAEESRAFLPDGEIKDLLSAAAARKQLPGPRPADPQPADERTFSLDYEQARQAGEEYRKTIKARTLPIPEPVLKPEPYVGVVSDARRAQLLRQKDEITAKYPAKSPARVGVLR
jgi:hypothetical protein